MRLLGVSTGSPGSPRMGFILAELLIAMAITLLVGGLAIALLVRQQRVYAGLDALVTTRATVNDAADILSADLRTVAPESDTIFFVSDTAIELRSTIGASIVTAIPLSTQVTLSPDTLPDGVLRTFWLATPDEDDDVLIYHDSTASWPSQGWDRLPIVSLKGTGPYTLTLAANVPSSVTVGAPARIIRRGRYSVYRASDKAWYLGYRRCPRTGPCSTVQPVSGPYDDSATPPIRFRCFTAAGDLITGTGPSTNAARLEIVARARSAASVIIPGARAGHVSDSTITIIAFRNR